MRPVLDLPSARAADPRVTPGPGPATPAGRPWWVLVLGCLVVSALSLLGPHALTYDPMAWLIWGREIVEGDLQTQYGPSWKPLPMLFTTPFALIAGDDADLLWLVIARAGGLMAMILAFRLTRRLAGTAAGVIAAVALLLSDAFISYATRGNSEGLLAALFLGAVERHLDERHGQAFAAGLGAALLRPEVWPLVGLYGLWLVHDRRRSGRPWATAALVAGSGVAILALWLIPEYIGSGNLLRAASRATLPVPGMPGEAAVPFVAVFTNGAKVVAWPLYAAGVLAVALAWRDRARDPAARLILVLAAIATSQMVLVALLTQTVGFTGNSRYLTVPMVVVCVTGAIGCVQAVRLARAHLTPGRARAAILVAAAIATPFVVGNVLRAGRQWSDVLREARHYGALPDLFARAGGDDAVVRCGLVYSRGFHTQVIAWELHAHEAQVSLRPRPPGTIVALHGSELLDDDRFTERISNSEWTLASTCPLPGT